MGTRSRSHCKNVYGCKKRLWGGPPANAAASSDHAGVDGFGPTWYDPEFSILKNCPFANQVVTMYAIIADGGRQYRVQEGDELEVDYRDVPKGNTLEFDRVLAVSDENGLKLGKPTVGGATVSAEVLGAKLGKKLVVQKLRRRKNSRRRTGHRQIFTRVRIGAIHGALPLSPSPTESLPTESLPTE